MMSVTLVAGSFFRPQFRRLFHRRVFTNDVKFLIFKQHYFVFLKWIHLFPKILALNRLRGVSVVVEKIILKACQGTSAVMPLTRLTRISKPKFLENCKKTQKMFQNQYQRSWKQFRRLPRNWNKNVRLIDDCFYYWNSNLVPLLEGLCKNPCRFEFSVFWVFAGIEPTTSGFTVPRSD